jgi:hypothetical protein
MKAKTVYFKLGEKLISKLISQILLLKNIGQKSIKRPVFGKYSTGGMQIWQGFLM